MKQFIDVATKEVTAPTTGKRTATLLLLLLLSGVVVASSQAIKMLEEDLKKYE